MLVTTRIGWVEAGKPAEQAQPIKDFCETAERHGYTAYWYPDERHLEAEPPEDHCPFSRTPWPGTQPYPHVLAADLMPLPGTDARALAPIARRIIADKRAGRAPWVKYLNWTDEEGQCWHTSWQPNEVTRKSTDRGHLHMSIRTDSTASTAAADWDPIAEEDDVALTDKIPNSGLGDGSGPRSGDQILADVELSMDPYAVHWQNEGLRNSRSLLAGQAALGAKVDGLLAALTAIAQGGTSVDTAAVISHIDEVSAGRVQLVDDLHAQIGQLSAQVADLQTRLAAAAQASAGALGS